MREIKFRVWDGVTKCMVLFDFEDLCRHNEEPFKETEDGINASYPLDYDELWLNPVMQYTGLKDKDGREIYEGDLVKLKYETPMAVVYYKSAFHLVYDGGKAECDFTPLWRIDGMEVVGNIYENPDLLTEGEKKGED